MTRTTKRMACTVLAAGAVVALTAGPALAAPSAFKPKLGNYKAKETGGKTFILTVGADTDGYYNPKAPVELYSPDSVKGKNNYIELNCKAVNGTSGVDDFGGVGPFKVGNGTIKNKSTSKDPFNAGSRRTVTYSFTIKTNGTISGTARLAETFADGTGCDSGTIKITAKR